MAILDVLIGFKNKIINPIAALLKFLKIPPDVLTWTGFFINVLGAYLIIEGKFPLAGTAIFFAGMFDMLDGAVARAMKKMTKAGGFLDSFTDRLSEGALFLGALIYYINTGEKESIMLAYYVLFISFLVSYIRARAGSLKIKCEAGFFVRTERISALIIGLWIGQLFWALVIIAGFSTITAIHRFILVYKEAKKLDRKK